MTSVGSPSFWVTTSAAFASASMSEVESSVEDDGRSAVISSIAICSTGEAGLFATGGGAELLRPAVTAVELGEAMASGTGSRESATGKVPESVTPMVSEAARGELTSSGWLREASSWPVAAAGPHLGCRVDVTGGGVEETAEASVGAAGEESLMRCIEERIGEGGADAISTADAFDCDVFPSGADVRGFSSSVLGDTT